MAEKSMVDGVRAIEMRYRAIRETDSDEIAFYQSQMWLNSPDMGVLMPDTYERILNAHEQCITVFKLGLIQILRAINKFKEREVDFKWISIYMPLRLLRRLDCVKTVSAIVEKYKVSPNLICFEISSTLLIGNDERCAENMEILREKGFHFMLDDFGGNTVPIMNISNYNFDYVMMNKSITDMINQSERADSCAKSMISFLNDYGAEPIANSIENDSANQKIYDFECSYYTGSLAGNFLLERFVRKPRKSN